MLSLPDTLRKRSSCMVDNLELGTPLGRGSYGKVYKGEALPSHATKMQTTCCFCWANCSLLAESGISLVWQVSCASCAAWPARCLWERAGWCGWHQ